MLLTPVQALIVLLVSWAAAVVLYRLRPRRRRVTVPFAPLWEALLLPAPTSQLWGRLRQVGSLLIACTVTGLLVLALTDPKPLFFHRTARSVLVLIDAGQHMQATDELPSRLEHARKLAERLVADKAPADVMLVAQMDATVTPLSALTTDGSALQAGLAKLMPTDATTDFHAAIEFAEQLLRERTNPTLVVISDGVFDADIATLDALHRVGVQVHHLLVGHSADNVGIRSFSARRYLSNRGQSEVMLTLENASARPRQLELTLLGDGSALSIAQLEIAPHTAVTRFYSDLPAQAERLEARIALKGAHDFLASDDRAFALLPPSHRTRILAVTAGNRYLEAALLLDGTPDVTLVSPNAYRDAQGYDLVIFDGCTPEVAPGIPSLFLAPPANAHDFPFRVTGRLKRPVFDVLTRDHPLLRYVALQDVNITSALILQPQPGDAIVAASGSTPLIIAGQRAAQPFVALSFDVRESDLPLRVAWPVFFSQVVDYLRHPDLDYRPTLRAGVAQPIALNRTAPYALVTAPNGESARVPAQGRALWLRPLHAGFYSIDLPGEHQLCAVDRDPNRSLGIQPRKLPAAHDSPPTAPNRWLPDDAWAVLLALTWLLVALEWLSYQRRWTA